MPLAAKGEFALVTEKIQAGLSRSGQPVKRGTMAHDHHMYMLLTESAVQLRDAGAIRRYAEQLEALAVRDGHQLYQAIAYRAWVVAHGLAGDYAPAEARLGQALELFRSFGTGWQLGRTFTAQAELAAARGDTAEARRAYQEALESFEALGAGPDAGRTRAALDALGPAD